MRTLSMIEDQLHRISENKALEKENIRQFFRTRTIKLMTAMLRYLNSALEYYGRRLISKFKVSSKLIGKAKPFTDPKNMKVKSKS